jgi:Cys-tRNA(Pro)/Cys-tRNA(Cys) deacylase
MNKTNAMRQLDSAKISYEAIEYVPDENDLSGVHIAEQTGLPPEIMFKTLVAKGEKKGPLVFCIPVAEELDLKKCAKAAGDKRVELVAVKDLLGLTGYIRGGCSPVGMKKKFPTYFDENVILYDKITVSAGVKGCQLMLDSKKIVDFTDAVIADIII